MIYTVPVCVTRNDSKLSYAVARMNHSNNVHRTKAKRSINWHVSFCVSWFSSFWPLYFLCTLRIRLIVIYFSFTYFHRVLKQKFIGFYQPPFLFCDLFIIGVSHTVSAKRANKKSLSTDWHVHEMYSGFVVFMHDVSDWKAAKKRKKK